MEALQRLHNRGSISTGFDIDNSCKFQRDGEYLKAEGRTQGTQTTWTYSTWVKRTDLSDTNEPYQNIFSAGSSSSNWCHAYFRGDGSYPDNEIFLYLDNGGAQYWLGRIQESFRDTAAWYHFVLAVDTTQSTAADRAKVYINGVQKTISNFTAPTQNASTRVGDGGGKFAIGALTDASHSFNGYIAECVLVDGSQLTPTSFGEFDNNSGIWKPKNVSSLSLGTTGFYINFDDASNMGKVTSGNNGGNFDKYGIDATNQAQDSPTNNFATWNVLANNAGIFTYTEGATKWKPTSGNWASTTASLGFTKGKWYAEFKAASNVTNVMVGVQELSGNYVGGYLGEFANSTSEGYGYYNANGDVYNNGGNSSYGASFPLSVLVGVALDFKDDGTALMYISKDNVWQNSADPANGTGGYSLNSGNAVEGFFSFAGSLYQNNDFLQANFGGYTVNTISSAASDANGYGTFEYAPPSGYYALCTKNLAEFG